MSIGSDPLVLDVAVIGGGIAGLAAAATLRRQGHHVTVYEQSRFLNEVGAAIHLAPNAARILKTLGFDPVRANAVQNSWSLNRQGDTMEVNWSRSLDYIVKDFGTPWYLFHRVDLHNELKRLAFEEGEGIPAVLQLGSRVISADTENTRITLHDGTEIHADVILGADGVHSKTVVAVTGRETPSSPTGQAAYRFIIPVVDLLKDSDTAWLVKDRPITMNIFPIEDRRIASYPCRNNTLFNFVGIHPERPDQNAIEDWNASASLESLMETYEQFHPSVKAVLRKAETLGDLKLWKLLSREPLRNWVRGNVCLIGDAAHPMLPHSGQGGGQSIEDAAALGILLSKLGSKSEIPQRLKAFEALRLRRASAIQILSSHGQDQAYKSQEAARPYIDGPVPANQREFHTFMYSYHVLVESAKVLDTLNSGKYASASWENGAIVV
ncbi:hypothetical protein ACN47E_008923 [Coniothyrium glycines]